MMKLTGGTVACLVLLAFPGWAWGVDRNPVDVCFRDDSGVTWIRLPAEAPPPNPNQLTINVERLRHDPEHAEEAATRTMSTLAEVADDYNLGRFSRFIRRVNSSQEKTYRYVVRWHKQLFTDNDLEVRRRRDDTVGDYLYVFGYRRNF